MTFRSAVRLLVAVALMALAACKRSPPGDKEIARGAETPKAHVEEDKEHEELPRVVTLSPEVVRAAKIETVKAEKRRLAATIDLNGQIVADPDHIAMLGARVAGRILKVHVREGDTVRAGQPIAAVTSPELARRRAEHAAAGARASAARRNAQRLRSLADQKLGADQDAVAAGAEAAAAEAERDASAQAVRGMGAPIETQGDPSLLSVVSPLAGQVVQRDAVPGQMIEPGHTIATVVDLSRVFFQAQLFEKDLARVKEGARAEVRLNGYPAKVFPAKVARVASQVDPQSRTLTARLSLAELTPEVRLGLFGSARISLAEEEGAEQVVIPLSAVTDVGDRKVAFVRQPDGHFELHELRVGATAGGSVAVLSGLAAGEEVVASGVHTLKSAVLKSTMEEEE